MADELKKEMDDIVEKLDKLDKLADEEDKEEDERFKQFEQDLKAESEKKLKEMNDKYKTDIDGHMSDVGSKYNSYQKDVMQNKQQIVLRANKVMREVPRALGTDWVEIFERLMAGFPDINAQTHIERFKRMPEVVQGYKAFTFWRECEGADFDVKKLIAFLRITGKDDLANEAERVLESEGDELFKPVHTPDTKPPPKKEKGEGGEAAATENGEDKPKPTIKKSTINKTSTSDGGLLALAKKVGPGWKGFGSALGVSEEEMEEIIESEGDTYQGCFKMLWAWRDMAHEHGQDTTAVLGEALKAAGKTELVETLS